MAQINKIAASVLVYAVSFSANAASLFTCDARDQSGLHYALKVDLKKKTYVLVDKNGVVEPLFDSQTICGWKPSAGTSDINCPLDAQTGPEGYLAVNLECDKSSETGPHPIITGNLEVQDGNGHLICYVYSDPQEHLGLSNCIAN